MYICFIFQVSEMNLLLVSEPSTVGGLSLPPSPLEGLQNPKETRYAHICWVMIVDDLLDVFMDAKYGIKEFKNKIAV